MNPNTYPFGQTKYKNYDPEQVNTTEEVAELLLWLAGENREEGNTEAASVYRDCAQILEEEVIDND